MKADPKLATRENVSTASAPFSVIGVAVDLRMTQHSSAMQAYAPTVATRRIARRFGLPRTSSRVWRSTAEMNREILRDDHCVPIISSKRRTQD